MSAYVDLYIRMFVPQKFRIKLDSDVCAFVCEFAFDAHKWMKYSNNFEFRSDTYILYLRDFDK